MIDEKRMLKAWRFVRDSFLGYLSAPVDDDYISMVIMSYHKLWGVLECMFMVGLLSRDDYVAQREFYCALYANRRFIFI